MHEGRAVTMKVLIVDDSRFIRQHIREMLERIGLTCEEAADGREALALLRGPDEFDFMLVDVNMPRMSGLECVKNLRDAGLQSPMKVMMVTSESDTSVIKRALECGADEFLMKPFSPESLREKLAMLGLAA
jgi:two-component system chemotaxis response regulator CheY